MTVTFTKGFCKWVIEMVNENLFTINYYKQNQNIKSSYKDFQETIILDNSLTANGWIRKEQI